MKKTERLLSLDAFRGFTMAVMVLVNNPGSWEHIYPQLEHAAWNGWTFTDFIFPFFLWSVGMSITFSLNSRVDRGDKRSRIVLQIFRRTILIFLIGLFLNGFPFGLLWNIPFSFSTIRIPGVLQRIAVGYCAASIAYLFLSKKMIGITIGVLLSTYWIMMKWIPVPGVELGSMQEGNNFAAYIDSLFLQGHMWKNTFTWDPEGIVSTVPAIATVLGGVLAGEYIRTGIHSKIEKVNWMFVTGSILLLLGVILDMWLPINKNLWTSSYAIFMAGWSLVIFSIFYFFIDVKGIQRWALPFIVYGSNAIAAYCISTIQESAVYGLTTSIVTSSGQLDTISLKDFWMQAFFNQYFSPLNASLIYGLLTVTVIYGMLFLLWKQRWFLKV
ncbi:MAG: DUF5009 domain-containing protein [Bacteroidota bacterium]|nr:DUF5009 domain-containing protein [Bacteroidota bacterium]